MPNHQPAPAAPRLSQVTHQATQHPLPRPGVLAVFLSLLALTVSAAPRHVYLTWQGDTSRTMTVNYQTLEPTETSTVYFDTKPRNGRPGNTAPRRPAAAHQIPGLADGRKIHWVELTGLKPGATYYFIAGDPEHGFTAERKFRTVTVGVAEPAVCRRRRHGNQWRGGRTAPAVGEVVAGLRRGRRGHRVCQRCAEEL